MSDREEFEKFWDWVKKEPFYDDLSGAEKSIAKRAWQARGELDAVRIKELELANKILIDMTDNMANQISEYEVIDKGQLERIKELESDLDDRKREVNLRCGQIQERDIRIAELTAKNKELEDKLDELVKFHSSADKLAEKQVDCIDQLAKFSTKLVIAVQALDCIASDIDTWHSDKAIEALNKIKGE